MLKTLCITLILSASATVAMAAPHESEKLSKLLGYERRHDAGPQTPWFGMSDFHGHHQPISVVSQPTQTQPSVVVPASQPQYGDAGAHSQSGNSGWWGHSDSSRHWNMCCMRDIERYLCCHPHPSGCSF
jgi:hypothetical protein